MLTRFRAPNRAARNWQRVAFRVSRELQAIVLFSIKKVFASANSIL